MNVSQRGCIDGGVPYEMPLNFSIIRPSEVDPENRKVSLIIVVED